MTVDYSSDPGAWQREIERRGSTMRTWAAPTSGPELVARLHRLASLQGHADQQRGLRDAAAELQRLYDRSHPPTA